MNMKARERNLVLAAILGVAAAALVWGLLSGQKAETVTDTQVVVAASNIPSGMPVTEADLSIRSFKKDSVPPDAATSKALVVGKLAKSSILAGQPILLSSVMTEAEGGFSPRVPPFMRAVTIGLDPVSGVAGFLKPGDRVDVVATFEMNSTSYAKTVLQNVLLFAIGSEAIEGGEKPAADKQTARVEPTATLVVTPSDAEKLILADAKGKLRLTLRSYNDKGIAPRRPVGTLAALGVAQENPAAAKSAPAGNPGLRQQLNGGGTGPGPGPGPLPPMPVALPGKTIVIVRGTTTSEAFFPSSPAGDPESGTFPHYFGPRVR